MSSPKRILVCPLDWGLGHATRCIPVIRLLLQKKAEVIIAGDGDVIILLKQEFPQLQYVYLKGYHIRYSTKRKMVFTMLVSAPKILFRIILEHEQLKTIVKEYQIDTVISDNRYGLWNKTANSIFITHQLMIKSTVAEDLLHRMVLFFVKKYDECWIPDVPGLLNLTGDLAHRYPLPHNTFFIGVLSRFKKPEESCAIRYDVLVLVSGPEPQREVFQKMMIDQLKQTSLRALVVCGQPGRSDKEREDKNIRIVAHRSAEKLQVAIEQAEIVIARSGYSTVMDLAVLGKRAVLIPTPGQTEQEYLAQKMMTDKLTFSQSQNSFSLTQALTMASKYKGLRVDDEGSLLETRVDRLLH